MTEVIDKRVRLSETAHQSIEFLQIGDSGEETLKSGYIWSPAPSMRGMRAFWVLPCGELGVARHAVVVVKVSRRHRVGTTYVDHRKRSRWMRSKGRFVDIGTHYTETHADSFTGSATRVGSVPSRTPTKIGVLPLEDVVLASLTGKSYDPLLQ